MDFKNAVIVMTSNIGSDRIQTLSSESAQEWEIEAAVKDLLKNHFRPEFLNRVDEIIVFHPLKKEQITRIVDIQLANLQKRLAMRNLKLELSEKARN